MKSGSDTDLSQFEGLTPEQQQRLTELLDGYLKALEEGTPWDRERLVAEHPDLAEPLASYLESLEYLQDAAAGFAPAQAAIELSGPSSGGERRVGDFQIVREIGRGGMGVVYEARQISLNRRVALKVLPFAALLDSKQIARFRNEAQAAAQLHHPSIVPVFAIGSEQGVHYYAMQYIDGRPLDRVIVSLRTAGSPPPECRGEAVDGIPPLERQYRESPREFFRSVARLVIQAAEALHAAHEVGVVHRDVKPSNLLLDGAGKLWVTDFGLARCRTDANLTRTGDFLGTMRYMSPEQTQGKPHLVDHRADIYGLGLTLYELLTQRPAVRGENPAAILRQLDREQPYRPRLWNPQIPLALENIVFKAIAKSREERYATALEFADDLRRFLEGKPTRAQRPSVFEQAGKWCWRHRLVVSLAAAVVLVIAMGTSVSTVLLARKERQTQAALRDARENARRVRVQFHTAQGRLAMLFEEAGNPDEARVCWERAIGEQRALLADEPDDETTSANLAASLCHLARLEAARLEAGQLEAGRLEAGQLEAGQLEAGQLEAGQANSERQDAGRLGDKAEAYLAESLGLYEELVQRFPAVSDYTYQLAMARDQRGRWCRGQGHLREAAGEFERAIGELRELSEREPGNRDYPRALSVIWSNLGLTQADLGQLGTAERSLRSALDCLRTVSVGQADDEERGVSAEELSTLAGVHNNLAHVLEQRSKLEQAAEHFTQAVAWQRRALERASWDARYGSHLLQHYGHLSRVLRRLRRWREAEHTVAARFQLCQGDAPQLLGLAADVALLWKAVRVSLTESRTTADNGGLEELAGRFARRSAMLLRQAGSLGLDVEDAVRREPAFQELQDDPDFRAAFTSSSSESASDLGP